MADFDADAIAAALAARYAPGVVTPPTGLHNVRSSTADAPNALGALPAVVVYASEGTFASGAGSPMGGGYRLGSQSWKVCFYFEKAGDLQRQLTAVRKWLTVLAGQLRQSIKLGDVVDRALLESWRVGILAFNGVDHVGIELTVETITSELWTTTA